PDEQRAGFARMRECEMVWPASCDGGASGQGMVGRNCGQVNRSTPEGRKALGRCFASAGQVDAENARSTLLTNGKVLLAGGEHLGRALGTLAVERLVHGWSVLPFSQQYRLRDSAPLSRCGAKER